MAGTFAVKATRVAIVVALFAVWELLSRTGIVNPRLLPSASDTLVDALGTAAARQRPQRSGGDGERGADRLRPRRSRRRPDRIR